MATGLGDVFQPVLAQACERELDEPRGCSRDDDLSTVRRGSDASSEVDVVSDVSLSGEQRLSGVQADANLDRPGSKGIRER